MRKWMWLVIFTLVSSVLSWAAEAEQKPTIKIGVILPMTGNSSTFGQGGRDGLLMRMKELSPDSKFKYELIFEDDGFESAKTNLAAQKLVSVDKVDVIISMWGQASSVIVPRLKGTDIINLGIDRWGNPFKEYRNDFIVGPGVEMYAQKMIVALKALKIKKLAMMTSALQGPLAYDNRLKVLLKENNIELVYYSMLPADIRDFRTAILKIREANPDAVMNDLMAPQTELFQKQMSELKYSPMVISPSAFLIDVSPQFKEGAFYTLNASPDKDFVERFKKTMGEEPKYLAPFTYDALSMLIAAAERLPGDKKPKNDEIAAELRKTKDFPASLGVTSFQAPNVLSSPVAFYLIKGGKAEEVTLDELVKYYNK